MGPEAVPVGGDADAAGPGATHLSPQLSQKPSVLTETPLLRCDGGDVRAPWGFLFIEHGTLAEARWEQNAHNAPESTHVPSCCVTAAAGLRPALPVSQALADT